MYSTREIVLSAGAIGTPTILQLSGIGPQAALQALGINTIINNPSVGQNLSDHPLLTNTYNVLGDQSFDKIFRDTNLFATTLNQWLTSFTGPFATGIANHLGFLRLPSTASIFSTVSDPAAGPQSSHFELIFSVSDVLAIIKNFPLTSYVESLGPSRCPCPKYRKLPERHDCCYITHFTCVIYLLLFYRP